MKYNLGGIVRISYAILLIALFYSMDISSQDGVYNSSLQDHVTKREYPVNDPETDKQIYLDLSEKISNARANKSFGISLIGLSAAGLAAALALDGTDKKVYGIAAAGAGIGTLFYTIGSGADKRSSKQLTNIIADNWLLPPYIEESGDDDYDPAAHRRDIDNYVADHLSSIEERERTMLSEIESRTIQLQDREAALMAARDSLERDKRALEARGLEKTGVAQMGNGSSGPELEAAQVNDTKVTDDKVSEVATTTEAPQVTYRNIQFTATGAGKRFPQLAYLGEVISEKIPGKQIWRYKIRTSQDAPYVITELSKQGYKGAFVSK